MNEMLATFFWKQLWQVTLLIPVAVLFVRYVLPRKPHLGYGILLLVLVKTIFPPIWDSPTGVVWEMVPYFSDSARTDSSTESTSPIPSIALKSTSVKPTAELDGSDPQQAMNAAPSVSFDDIESKSKQPAAVSASPWHWGAILFGVWLAGALCLFGYIIGKRAQLLRFHRDMQVAASDRLLELIEEVSAELGLLRIPTVLVTRHPTVPFATGFFRQIVVLPEHVVKQTDPEELKLVLAHEMTHLRRGDTLIGLLQLLVQVVWWFHPLVHWLNVEVRRLREECCDTDVVAQLNCQPASYARCLLNMLEMHQKLRPSTELVGLSPFEVTAKRMQNIMRSPQRNPNRLGNIARSVGMLCVALAILPATASSSVTPKVIVGELNPPKAVREAPQQRPPKKSPRRKKKAPPEKRNGSRVESKPESKEPSPQPAAPDHFRPLKYDWMRGDRHTYSITIEAKYPLQIRTDRGTPTFRVDAYAAGLPALSMKNANFSKQSIPREGVELPTLPDLDDADVEAPLFPYTAGRAFRPGFSTRPETNSSAFISGSNGHVNPSTGQLPYLLGSLKDWVFPTLPQVGNSVWQEESTRDFDLTPDNFVSLNPFSSPPKERMRANIQIKSSVQSVTKSRVTILRTWTLRTEQEANGEPRREISLSGELHLDPNSSFPISASYTGRLVERERNREYRIPLKIDIRRKNE